MNYVEQDCTITHHDKNFTAHGASVSEHYLVAYLKSDCDERVGHSYPLTDWHGNEIGTVMITGRWRTLNGWVSSHMVSGRAEVDGVVYNVRGCGAGMTIQGAAKRPKKRAVRS